MRDTLLICTDLDRTLMPNGPQPESPQAREYFRKLASRSEVQLAYVTGRNRTLVEQAIDEYDLPKPDFVIGDVGTSIYDVDGARWSLWQSWHDTLAGDWHTLDGKALISLFSDLKELTPQETEKQGRFKSSYYAPVTIEFQMLKERMKERLEQASLSSRIIWSIDDNLQIGLVDVLPRQASKLNALRFLMSKTGHSPGNSLFAGDSGNDLAVLGSEIPAVLVANATQSVREQAVQLCKRNGTEHAFYLAQGGFHSMNGNYSAGLLEGLAHFQSRTNAWIF